MFDRDSDIRWICWFKDIRLGLREFLATESILKMMKNIFDFTLKNKKIVWKVVWIEHCLQLNCLHCLLEFSTILGPRLLQNTSNVNTECARKSKQLYSLCNQLLGALINLHSIVLILTWFSLIIHDGVNNVMDG